MANRTLEVDCPQGLTLTAELFTPGADTVVASVALTERTNDKGCYTGTIASITGGLYRIRIKSGTTTIARGILRHTDATGVERPDDVDGILSATHGTGQWDAVGSGGGGGGTGAYAVTITVNDGATLLQNATVRMSEGVNSFTGTTDVDGEVSFSLDAATYDVTISKGGYTFTPTTLAVSGATSHTYSMTVNSISPPSSPSLSVLSQICLGTDGQIEEGVEVHFWMTAGPGTAGYVLDSSRFTLTSDVNGILKTESGDDPEFVRGATYKACRGEQWKTAVTKVVPNASSFSWPEILGGP